ncbi:shootin-1 isoform X2 [Pseudochaenichthys georgianus]|uniref:shootin-1 isoform X2 n=1 Tax=Pseudochaenichthys georgianus TaxID=52239 RepID=UPI00146A4F0F|nr:shootin-1 isoform X2 [Pseudochaenichthys georgianus]
MWMQREDIAESESDGDGGLSSEDEGDVQCEILELQRDEANQRLSELEEASNQLLKEINVLEMQFQMERSCRESAEALAVKVTRENKVLKRKSQMMMPLIPELPENFDGLTFDQETDPAVNGEDVLDLGEETLLQSQASIAELQASVDGLLAEKLQLEQRVEDLTKEQAHLTEQLALEVEEKEAILRRISKQSKTMNKIERVSQLVTDEFTEMSQELELEQGLRQRAEVFAHQMLVQQELAHSECVTPQSSDAGLQLQRALEQISSISSALCDIQRLYQEQVEPSQGAGDERGIVSELQNLRAELESSEEERKTLVTQLSEANGTVTQLREEVKQFQDTLKEDEQEEKTPPPPPPPPPPPAVTNTLDFLRSRRKEGASNADQNTEPVDMKTRAVDEMMERIKKGIILRPIMRVQEDDSAWTDQKSENRKSAILELKGMLDIMKHQKLRRVPSRRGMGRNVGEAELLQVLQRRRRAMGDQQDQTQEPQTGAQCVPAAGDCPWAGESSRAPVLRRLKQNREKRDSRIRASALILGQEN